MEIAAALKRFRKEFKLGQKDVADALGIMPQSYQVYERAEKPVIPSAKALKKIAESFGVSMDYLAGLSDVPRLPDTKTLVDAISSCQKILGDALDGRNE